MNTVVPPSFLFRFGIPVQCVAGIPRKGRRLLNLADDCRLPDVGRIDGVTPFAELRIAWNPDGLGIDAAISGKKHVPFCTSDGPTESDGLHVWIDTRSTQNVHRASRFCHSFCLLPAGGGQQHADPCVFQLPIAQARENAPDVDVKQIQLASRVLKTGYRLEAWFPASVLHGYAPDVSASLGFFFLARDVELGDQYLGANADFPVTHDPSLWSTLNLLP